MASVAAGRAGADDTVLVDEEGHRYTIKQLSKSEVRYHKLDGGWIRVRPYFQYRLEREDDQYLYVRVYIPPSPAPTSATPARPTVGSDSAGAASPAKIDTVDRVTLTPFSDGLPSAGQWRNRFVLADMNGDGHLDLVHGPPRKGGGGPRIFLGDSAGHWKPWSDAVYPFAAYDYGAVAVADFNGDSQLDIVLAAHLRGITVLLGDGHGRFRLGNSPGDFEPDEATRFTTRALLAEDWNRDGKLDLVTLGEGPAPGVGGSSVGWRVYVNQGNGRWQKTAQPPSAAYTFGDSLAVGDFNGDGHEDLLTASLSLGNRDILHYGGAAVRTVTLESIHPRAFVESVASADLDANGRPDLVLGYLAHDDGQWRSLIDILLAQPDGTWRRVVVDERAARIVTYAIAAGDVDGDGHQDLVALDDAGSVRIFLGDGAGNFSVEASPELPAISAGCRGYFVQLADLNRDQRAEIVAAFASEVSPLSGEPGCPEDGRLQAWSPQPKQH